MKNDILFSIIVPVYNTEKYVKKCLTSIKNAMKLDCEVIIVNDGSTDNSEKEIKDFINELPREYKENFIYKYKTNKGLADTKNVGISLSKGKYISVVDSDDYISDDFYDISRKYIDEGYDVIVYDLYVIYENENNVNYIDRAYRDDIKDLKKALVCGAMQGSSCNKIIKKTLYNSYKFPIDKEYEDTSVTPFILYDAKKIKYIPYPIYYYLQREKSIVANNTYISAFYKICENISNELEIRKNYEKYEEIINEFFVNRILDIIYQDYNENVDRFTKNMFDFSENNQEVISYILDKDLIYKNNMYSKRQKDILVKILENAKEKNISNIRKILFKRKAVNYLRRIFRGAKELVKAILGREY